MSLSSQSALRDPVILHHVWQATRYGLSGYLIGLAAFQRGLNIRFFSRPSRVSQRFQQLDYHCPSSIFQRISDGRRTHDFWESMGDGTSPEQSLICDDKRLTRQLLEKHHLPVPQGIEVVASDVTKADAFLSSHREQRFVLKPVVGSLAQGVHVQQTAADIRARLKSLREPHLLESHVDGEEFRVAVIGGEQFFVYRRHQACVIGNGHSTVEMLIAEFNQQRQRNPAFFKDQVTIDDSLQAILNEQSFTLRSVPPAQHRVTLSLFPTSRYGGTLEVVDCVRLSENTRNVIRQVAAVTGLPNFGLDLIQAADGSPVILEINQRHALGGHVFPDNGVFDNSVAEAIVDHYFPESRERRHWPLASFDFSTIGALLDSNQHAEIALPGIQDDWQHQRLRFTLEQSYRVNDTSLRNLFSQHGLFAHVIRLPDGGMLADILCEPSRWQRFQKHMNHIGASAI